MNKKKIYVTLIGIVLLLLVISYSDLFSVSNNLIYTLNKNFDNTIITGFDTNSLKGNFIFAIYVALFMLIFVYADTSKGKKISIMLYLLLIVSIFLKKVLILFIMYILIFPVILIVGIRNEKQIKKQKEEEKKQLNNDEERLNMKNAFNTFVDIQKAYTDFDYDKLKKSISSELYKIYSQELDCLKLSGHKKIMKNFKLVDESVISMKEFDNTFVVVMNMEISFLDYVIDENKKIISGSDKEKITYKYKLHFEYDKGARIECQKCGAPVKFDDKSCNYCNALLLELSLTPKLINVEKDEM